MYAPIARILLRYGLGLVVGMSMAGQIAADPDMVMVAAGLIAAGVEGAYALAKRRGWTT